MTFVERYKQESTWQGKAMIMEIYHLAMSAQVKNWTITNTSQHFNVSIGLVSENLRLANALHNNPHLFQPISRQEALVKLRRM